MTSSIFLILLNFSTLTHQLQDSAGVAFSVAKQNSKSRLIVFSGSDWCKNCILFRKKVLSSPDFQTFAKDNLEIVTADFPQRTQLPKDQIARNEALAEKYNPKGEFPKLILIQPDESDYKVVTFTNQSPDEFIAELKNLLPGK